MQYWAGIAAGDRGVDYHPQDAGNKSDFDVDPTITATAAKNEVEIGTLGPCILTGKPVTATPDPNDKTHYKGYTYGNFIHVGAWKYGNTVCVVAVNTERVPEKVSFTVHGLTSASAQVFWEGRRVKVKSGTVTDFFASQGVHRYVAILTAEEVTKTEERAALEPVILAIKPTQKNAATVTILYADVLLHESGRVSGSISLGFRGVSQALGWTSRRRRPPRVSWITNADKVAEAPGLRNCNAARRSPATRRSCNRAGATEALETRADERETEAVASPSFRDRQTPPIRRHARLAAAGRPVCRRGACGV